MYFHFAGRVTHHLIKQGMIHDRLFLHHHCILPLVTNSPVYPFFHSSKPFLFHFHRLSSSISLYLSIPPLSLHPPSNMQPITLTSLFVTFLLALLPNLALANPEENAAQMPCKGVSLLPIPLFLGFGCCARVSSLAGISFLSSTTTI